MGLFDFIFKKAEKKPAPAKADYYNLFLSEKTKADEYFKKGTVSGKIIGTDALNDIIYNCRTYYEKYLEGLYDFATVEGIQNIPLVTHSEGEQGGTPCYNLDYVLRLKATSYKKDNIDLAIACLRKANEISSYSNIAWGEKDFMRVVEFLKDAGRFDEARSEEKFIYNTYLKKDDISFSRCYDKDSPFFGNDLIESTADTFVCEECAKYTKRIYSEYGKNPKYPILPKYFKEDLPKHKHCAIHFYPYIEGSTTTWDYSDDLIEYCNRPYKDERTAEQKELFESEVAKRERAEVVKAEFDWIRESLPDIAPKSLSGYSKMKNLKSEKYMMILSAAEEKGKHLIE